LTFLLLPRRNPRLYSLINISLSSSLQRAAALLSVLAMGGIIAIQVVQDLQTLGAQSLRQRLVDHSLTSVELALTWGLIGTMLYAYGRIRRRHEARDDEIIFAELETRRENSNGDGREKSPGDGS
jgi:hypothetical protein